MSMVGSSIRLSWSIQAFLGTIYSPDRALPRRQGGCPYPDSLSSANPLRALALALLRRFWGTRAPS
jgi:hypothetical protein